jgi:hypothetical protein
VSSTRTLWEEGRRPGRLVANASVAFALVVVVLDLVITGGISLLFDAAFVALCLGAALWVRPRDFFMIGVLPPLLMAAVVAVLAVVDRSAVADLRDGFVQAVVSGLAHHAGALVVGYGLTLGVLAMRQTARRNHGRIRRSATRPAGRSTRHAPRPSRPAGQAARPSRPFPTPVTGAEPHVPQQRSVEETAAIR